MYCFRKINYLPYKYIQSKICLKVTKYKCTSSKTNKLNTSELFMFKYSLQNKCLKLFKEDVFIYLF